MPSKPKLGQNFLHDEQAIQRIAASIGDCTGRTVVEIGPGKGAITGALAARAGRVIAIELDTGLATHLRAHFPTDRLEIANEDVLDFDLDRAVLMVQREVADRVAAEPSSRDYGLLSVTVQMYGPVEKLFTVPPNAFTPPPKVHSTVFRWRFAPRFAELGVEPQEFLRFVRIAFAQKRKTLANNLRAVGISPAAVESALFSAGIAPLSRAEAVNIETLAKLWRALKAEEATSINEVTPSITS